MRHSTCLFSACRPSQPPQPTTPLHPFWPAFTATPPGSLLTPLPSQAQLWVAASSLQTSAREALHHHCHLPCPPLSSPLKLISSWPCSRTRVAVCNTSIAAPPGCKCTEQGGAGEQGTGEGRGSGTGKQQGGGVLRSRGWAVKQRQALGRVWLKNFKQGGASTGRAGK